MQLSLTHIWEDGSWSEHSSPSAAKARSAVVHNSLQQLEAEAPWDVAKLTYLKWSLNKEIKRRHSKTARGQKLPNSPLSFCCHLIQTKSAGFILTGKPQIIKTNSSFSSQSNSAALLLLAASAFHSQDLEPPAATPLEIAGIQKYHCPEIGDST